MPASKYYCQTFILLACTFEDECAKDFVQNDAGKVFNWKLVHSQRDMADKGETNGRFMAAYIKKSYKRNDYAVFSTNQIPIQKSQQCASFRYFMNDRKGCDVARLFFIMECAGKKEILFQDSHQQGNRWVGKMFNIKKTPGTKCKVSNIR